jgi:hypothetical protein
MKLMKGAKQKRTLQEEIRIGYEKIITRWSFQSRE